MMGLGGWGGSRPIASLRPSRPNMKFHTAKPQRSPRSAKRFENLADAAGKEGEKSYFPPAIHGSISLRPFDLSGFAVNLFFVA